MSYQAAHYNAVFQAMRERFGESWYASIDPTSWSVWRKQIKDIFFDEGILIREMVAGLDEAADKKRWPQGVSFFLRLRDVCLKNRREHWTDRQDGMAPLANLLPR